MFFYVLWREMMIIFIISVDKNKGYIICFHYYKQKKTGNLFLYNLDYSGLVKIQIYPYTQKKPSARQPEDYRQISFMIHLFKLFSYYINTIKHHHLFSIFYYLIWLFSYQIGDPGSIRTILGVTKEALLAVQILFQRCTAVDFDVHICPIDHQKP